MPTTFYLTSAFTAPLGCASPVDRGPGLDAGNGAMAIVFAGRRAR